MQEYKNGMKREREYLHVTLSLEHWASGDELRASHRSQVQSGVLSKHWWPPVCVWLTSYTLAHTDTPWHTLWHTLEHWQTLAHTHAHPGVLTHPGTHCCLYTTTKIPRTFITYNSYYGIYHPKKRKAKWRVIFSFLFSLSLFFVAVRGMSELWSSSPSLSQPPVVLCSARHTQPVLTSWVGLSNQAQFFLIRHKLIVLCSSFIFSRYI